MDRQIKFRFWGKFGELNEEKDECENEMLYGDRFCFSEHAPINDLFADKSFVAMQFTGLTDKNGNEIYEGDVLSNSTGKIDKVIFYENGFFGKSKSNMGKNHYWYNPLCADYIKNKEVIGNIYENPELLKK